MENYSRGQITATRAMVLDALSIANPYNTVELKGEVPYGPLR
jgi:hypothetical protein